MNGSVMPGGGGGSWVVILVIGKVTDFLNVEFSQDLGVADLLVIRRSKNSSFIK